MQKKAFTLLELLIVIAIIAVLGTTGFVILKDTKEKYYLNSAKSNFSSLSLALQAYAISNNGVYPSDVDRSVPPQLTYELKGTNWPQAPWPDSVYDWDNWTDPSTGEPIYQFSIRFCPSGNPSGCKFPDAPWAKDFDYYSSVYYCIQGACRSHINKPVDHPGYCVNC